LSIENFGESGKKKEIEKNGAEFEQF